MKFISFKKIEVKFEFEQTLNQTKPYGIAVFMIYSNLTSPSGLNFKPLRDKSTQTFQKK